MARLAAFSVFAAVVLPVVCAATPQVYSWKNVKIGGGGGFVPGIVFNPKEKGLAYVRTDIGGAYKLNADDTWTPLLDYADDARWNYWGVDALATDPVDPNRLYLATGMYTNSWDPNNGNILVSTDRGKTFTPSALPFKIGGNMPGRGLGERLVVDPNLNSVVYFGARSGNGLFKSTDYGKTWAKVVNFPSAGTYIADPSDTNGYNSDIVGIAWVTFDSTSGTSGAATPRIFVGVANKDSNSIFVSTNAGSTWSAVSGQPTAYLPHTGAISPTDKTLYISYSDGAGPYDGGAGAVYKYSITNSTWTDITPVAGSNLYFGFGGLSIDIQNPGTVMVAALNSWWPDGQIFRSTNSGASWTPLWGYSSTGAYEKYYSYSNSLAPWLGPNYPVTEQGTLQIGWMMEGLAIDPFDSNHFLYGTGATIYGSRDLLKWDSVHNITLMSVADGIEETSVKNVISPPTGPHLASAVGDIGGFVHNNMDTAPSTGFTNPTWPTTSDIDYAGNKPTNFVRVGTGDSSTGKQVALSTDSGATWNQDYGAADNIQGGQIAYSADADIVLWRTDGNGVMVSQYTNAFTAVSSLPATAVIASDKKANSVFYAAAYASFYLSTDGGNTFSARAALGSSTSPFKIVVNPSVTGDVWVSTDKGLYHSTNSGTSFTTISGVSQAWGIALGAPASSGGYPALYAAANIEGIGYYRSDDTGASWFKINDASHGFGAASANSIAADPRIYGRVYVGTNGRGIFYGDIASGAGVPVSTTAPNSVSSSTTVPTSVVSSTSASSPSASGIATAYGQCGGMSSTTHERVIAETTQVPIGQVQRLAYLVSNALKAMIFIPNVCRFEIKSDLV